MVKPIEFEEDDPLSPELLAAIGYVATQWAHLEDCIGNLTAFLLKTDHHRFRAIATNMTSLSRIDSFEAVATLFLTGTNLAKAKELVKRARGQSNERNRIVHGYWYPAQNPTHGDRITYVARDGRLDQKWEPVSPARMLGTGREIASVRRDIQLFLEKLAKYRRARQKASRKKSRPPSSPSH